jgi:hypothetical protein
MSSATLPPRHLGMLGSVIGLVALIAAILPHWVVPVVFPPAPLDQVIVETGHRVKERLIARAKGLEYQKPPKEKTAGAVWSDASSMAAIWLGLIAIILAVLSQFRREQKLYAGMSAALGVGAIAFELIFIAIGALIVIAIIYAVLDHIGLF